MSGNLDERAMRIMEALSDVDEELLERSEKMQMPGTKVPGTQTYNRDDTQESNVLESGIQEFSTRKSGKQRSGIQEFGGRVRKPLWQRTKAWAAVLCLAVAGGIAWGGYYLERVGIGSDNSMNSSGMMAGGAVDGNQFAAGESVPMLSTDGVSAEGESPVTKPEVGAGMEVGSNTNTGSGFTTNGNLQGNGSPSSLPNGTFQRMDITEEEARNLEGLGNYIPTALPDGYVFESAYSGVENEISGEMPDYLEITWIRGEDKIVLSVEKESACDIVDVGNPETYDVRLYKKSSMENVPEEYRPVLAVPEKYRAVFDDPVFALGDFDEEIVKSRMVPIAKDGEDADIGEGNFSVLYPDHVLVRFNGTGTVEEIWAMFCSVGE